MKKCLIALLCLALLASSPARARAETRPVRIAMIDSGISTRHIRADHILAGKNYVFPNNDTEDRIGHGSATAGMVLGAEDQGVTGICPEAELVPLVVVDAYPSGVTENGGTAALCGAIYDAVDEFDCRIINVSLSTQEDTPELRAAVEYAERHGVVVVSAVGNEGAGGPACYPAAYDTVVAVGSFDGEGRAEFSQPGANVLADGVRLRAATHRNSATPATLSGTSYSCAIVTAYLARIVAACPSLTPSMLRELLPLWTEDLGDVGYDADTGWGLLRTERGIPAPYLDLPAGTWHTDAVLSLTERGVLSGTEAGLVSPYAPATRAMAVTALWRLVGSPEAGTASGFPDVAPWSWFAPAVAWAVSEGLVQGDGSGLFHPNHPATREQLAVLLYRYELKIGPVASGAADADGLGRFVDSNAVSPWAIDALCWAVGTGLLTGVGPDTLSPAAAASRAELAVLLARYAAPHYGPSPSHTKQKTGAVGDGS